MSTTHDSPGTEAVASGTAGATQSLLPLDRPSFDHRKYVPYLPIVLRDRTWPDRVIEAAPDWCSVDLRDGNQAPVAPMSVEQKLELFDLLVEIGFKDIEIGFPSAWQTELDFTRRLIDEPSIPSDASLRCLTQARRHLTEKTSEALNGVERAIVHVYNTTPPVPRWKVSAADRDEFIRIAVEGARLVKEASAKRPGTRSIFQYSP